MVTVSAEMFILIHALLVAHGSRTFDIMKMKAHVVKMINGTILVFRSSYCEINQRSYEQIYAVAHEEGWHVQLIEYGRATGSAPVWSSDDLRVNVPEAIKFWKPDGCLVESSMGPWGLTPQDFKGVPTVFFEWHPSCLPKWAHCVFNDGRAIAACAARELMMTGVKNFAYVPYLDVMRKDVRDKAVSELYWSRNRREEFERILKMNGCGPLIVSDGLKWNGSKEDLKIFSKWILSLPRPCGVFAANDSVARQVILACRMAGVSVPDDIAVVGVDDVVGLCENMSPTISSVRTDNESSGRVAAEYLRDLIRNPSLKGGSRTYGVLGIIRRESTCRFPSIDGRVRKALEYIRKHACEGITPPDVFKIMGCSRSLANLRFRRDVHHSILDEIHAARLEKVKEMLTRTSYDVTTLANACGYSSLSDLRRVFRQRVGCTLREYRRKHTA